MNAVPSQLYLTVEEWARYEDDDRELKHELIEGVVYAMAGASNRHNDISAAVLAQLYRPAREHGCRAVASDQRLAIGTRNGFYPDVAVFCSEPDDGQFRRLPCLLIEVVSPSSRQRDYETKSIAYLQIPSLLAYLIIDAARGVVEAHQRESGMAPWVSRTVPFGSAITLTCPPIVLDTSEFEA